MERQSRKEIKKGGSVLITAAAFPVALRQTDVDAGRRTTWLLR